MLVRVHGSNACVLAINIYIIVDCDTIGVCDSICISASSCASVARSMVVLPMPMVVLEEIGYCKISAFLEV
jgi:hypothetical protein